MRIIIITILFMVIGKEVLAQPYTLNEKIKPLELFLTDYITTKPNEKGKIAGVQVTQREDTLYFFVKAISVLSPVIVSVISEAKTEKVKISLHKDLWTEVEKGGVTDGAGNWLTAFKTGGDFGVRIICKKNTKYDLMVWVGNDVVISMPSIFKKYKK